MLVLCDSSLIVSVIKEIMILIVGDLLVKSKEWLD